MAGLSSPPEPTEDGWSDADTWLAQSGGQPKEAKEDLPDAGALPPPLKPRRLLPKLPLGKSKDRKADFNEKRHRGPIENLRLLLTIGTGVALLATVFGIGNACFQWDDTMETGHRMTNAMIFMMMTSFLMPLSTGFSAFIMFRVGIILLDLADKIRVTDKNQYPNSTKQRSDG